MPTFRVIEKRESHGEALIEAEGYAEAVEKAEYLSSHEESYRFEWSDGGRISLKVKQEQD